MNQVRRSGDMWSIKINHSARPRNRSIRNSRSYDENETAGLANIAGGGVVRSDPPDDDGSGGEATRSVVDTFYPVSARNGSSARIVQLYCQVC